MHGNERLVICSSPNGRGIEKYAEYLSRLMGAEIVTCARDTRYFMVWEVFGILRYVRRLRRAEEIVFANTRVSPLLWALIDWQRVTVVVHDLMDTIVEKEGNRKVSHARKEVRIARRINSWFMRVSIIKAGRIVFNSRYTQSEVRRWIGNRDVKGCIISPPPSFERLVRKTSIKEDRQVEGNKGLRLLAVTGTSRNKAHEDYASFHRGLEVRIGRGVELVMYGIRLSQTSSQFRDWVVNGEGKVMVKYKREEEELLDDYLDCDFVVSLSSEEGYGMPVADALGFGIPVIAKSIDAFNEIKVDLDLDGIMLLSDSVSECIDKAAGLVEGWLVGGTREERLEKYGRFCMMHETKAAAVLRGLREDN